MKKVPHHNSLRITMEDIELFSQASHDRNPLHLSLSYSRRTPYGQPVVFGVLCGIASIGFTCRRLGYNASNIEMEFLGPIFTEVDYRVETLEISSDETSIGVFDGRRQLLKCSIKYKEISNNKVQSDKFSLLPINGIAPRTEAVKTIPKELVQGHNVKGSYMHSSEPFEKLAEKFELFNRGISESQYSALMCCSYLVGMELPGTDALFSELKIDFDNSDSCLDKDLYFNMELENYDKRFDLLNIIGNFTSNHKQFAKIQLVSFVRNNEQIINDSIINIDDKLSDQFTGKVAMVTGASRGLGAAITRNLVMHGCTVFVNYHQSHNEAKELKESLIGSRGTVILVPGDITDYDYCEEIMIRITEEYGKLDYLFLNATPPLLPLWLEPTAIQRIHEFILKSISMASIPMTTYLQLLAQSGGQQIFISTSAVQEATAEWPHYVAAKSAIEGMLRAAALEYPKVKFNITRFNRILTDLTNTPMGRKGAMSPEAAAYQLVSAIASPLNERGKVTILDID